MAEAQTHVACSPPRAAPRPMPGQNRGPSVHLADQTLSTRRMQQWPRHPLGKSGGGGGFGVVKKHYYREKSREGGQKSVEVEPV